MQIETLEDLNAVLSACGCCPLPDFVAPLIDGQHFYLVQYPCYEKSVLYNGGIYYYKKFENSLVIDHTTITGVLQNYTSLDTSGKTWNVATLTCDTDVPTSQSSGSVSCPFGTTSNVDTEIGVPPADFIKRNVQTRGPDGPVHSYVATRELSYKQGYDWPDDLRTEADDVVAEKVANEEFDVGSFRSDYTWGLSAVVLRTARFRWDITNHIGAWFKVTWDVAFYPEDGGAAQPFLLDQTWEWTGPSGGPPAGSEDNWKSPFFVVYAPPEKGEYKIVNIRYSGYRSTKFGTPVKVTGNAEDYT